MNVTEKLAVRTRSIGTNAIREILKVVSQPGMISLAGGIPSGDSLPLALMHRLTYVVLEKYGASALQYDATEGFGPLREALVDYLSTHSIQAASRDILISSGSQGVLDSLGMILITKGDMVAVESPTYIGALQAFGPYEPQYAELATDDMGVIPDALVETLESKPVKFVYLVPTFQNPTGRTMSLERRRAVARLIKKYDVLLVEDDPYSALRYRGERLPPIKSLAPEHVVYVSSLSKIFAPGLRIGYCVAPEPLRKWLVIAKQGVDLQTSTFSQALAAEYLTGEYLQEQVPKIISLYKPRQAALLKALQKHFPSYCRWTTPDGGMFVWVEGPAGLDMTSVYDLAIKQNVAFVPGTYFYASQGMGLQTMRLNFTMCDEALLETAVGTLAGIIDRLHMGAYFKLL